MFASSACAGAVEPHFSCVFAAIAEGAHVVIDGFWRKSSATARIVYVFICIRIV